MERIFSINPVIISSIIFITTYTLLIIRKNNKGIIGISGALLMLLVGIISPLKALVSINWNILGIFWGTMVLAELFILSGTPEYLAEKILKRVHKIGHLILALSLFSGFISIACENVATVLIVAPIAFSISKKLKISPVPFLITIAISSNLQGAATLIGDPPSMILAAYTGMNFNDFFFINGKWSIFWAVQIGAIASIIVLYILFRKYHTEVSIESHSKIKTHIPTILLVGLTISLMISSSFGNFHYTGGLISVLFAFVGIIWYFTKDKMETIKILKNIDMDTILLLSGIFIIVASLNNAGVIDIIANFIRKITGGNILYTFWTIVFFSVLISAFIDNIPYLTAMMPVVLDLSAGLNISPYLLSFALLLGASLGGNITPIGASANIVATGMLRKRGYSVSFTEFVKIGLPFTLSAVITGSIFVYWIWH